MIRSISDGILVILIVMGAGTAAALLWTLGCMFRLVGLAEPKVYLPAGFETDIWPDRQ